MRIPFATQSYESRSLPASAQKLVNMYLEAVAEFEPDRFPVHGAAGLKLFSQLSGPSRGLHVMKGVLFAVMGGTLYKVPQSGPTVDLGLISGTDPVSMANNGTQIVIVHDTKGSVYDGTDIRPITDPDFPGATSVTYQDGFFIFTRPESGQYFLSSLFDGFNYDALDFATAEGAPDDAKMVLSDHRDLWVFGTETTEVQFNSGGSFPFERKAFIEQGIGSSRGAAKLDNSIIIFGNDGVLYRYSEFTPVRISNHDVEKAIRGYADKESLDIFTSVLDGHKAVVFSWAEGCWVIDLTTNLWHERASKDSIGRDLGRWRACCGVMAYGKNLVGDFENGKIYELDLDTPDEDGIPMKRIARSAKVGDSVNTQFMGSLEMIVETGVGLSTGQGSDPKIMLRWSDDGGRTWSNEHWRDLGEQGDYPQRVRWDRMGSFESRMFEAVISDPIQVSIIAADASG